LRLIKFAVLAYLSDIRGLINGIEEEQL